LDGNDFSPRLEIKNPAKFIREIRERFIEIKEDLSDPSIQLPYQD
jgi:hypothetical protein